MEKLFENFNYSLIEKGDKVGVALSGGKDSVSLFFTLLNYSKVFPFTLCAINVEHGIRPTSKEDSDFVKTLCDKHGIVLYAKSVDAVSYAKTQKTPLENAARDLRYGFFEELKTSGKVDKVALAHHANDNAETVLYNLFRGSGLKGAAGIAEKRDFYIRPMLKIKRSEIERFISLNNLPFVTDETNEDVTYKRNYLRKIVIPNVEKAFGGAVDSLSRFSENARLDLEALDGLSKKIVKIENGDPVIYFADLSYQAINARAVFFALETLGLYKDVYKINVEDILSLKEKENGSRIDVTDNVSVYKEYDKLVFAKRQEKETFSKKIEVGVFSFKNTRYEIIKSEKFENKPCTLAFDFDKLPENAIIRTRLDGDVFLRKSGKVKLKEYLIDKKIPARKRDSLLFIAADHEILAVLCSECGLPLFVDKTSKNVLEISSKEKGDYYE